jgi:hypothetical protein
LIHSSTSLAWQPFEFGLDFPHDRCPLPSVQSSCSPSFTSIFLKSHSTSSIYLNLSLPFLVPPPGLPSSNFFTLLQI